jgi:hypothetical protein
MKVVRPFEMSWRHYPTTRRNNPKDVLLNTNISLQLTKSFAGAISKW